MEHLALDLKHLAAVGDTGAIEGLAWPFGAADRSGDVIEKGAFSALALPMPMLFGHDPNDPVGAWTEAHEGPDGLHLKGRLLVEDVARAREVHAMVKAGAVRGLSIGFITKKAAPRARGGRTISALDLFECSLVSTPMHPGAHVTAVKGVQGNTMADETNPAPAELETRVGGLEGRMTAVEETLSGLSGGAGETEQKSLGSRLDKLEARLNRPGMTAPAGGRTLEQKAFTSFLRRDMAGVPEGERKALTVASDASAGYLVAPDQLLLEILKTVTEFSPMRQVARVTGISAGGAIVPRRTSAPSAGWVDEIEERPETSAAYEQVKVDVHEAACWVDVSQRLLEDAAFDIEGELAAELGLAFAKLEATAFVKGTGTKQPTGFLTATGLTNLESALTAEALIELYHAIPSAYVGQAVWAMNRKTMAAVRKLKASDGHFLWQDGLSAGNPPTILGRPVMEFADMDDVETAAVPIAFGDFGTAYRIFDRVGLSVMRDPYSQATKGIVRFHARRRVGGLVVMPEALATLTIPA